MANEDSRDKSAQERRPVDVETTSTGEDRYRIVASATFDTGPAAVWELLWDWERFLSVGLPGQTSDFKWLSGGPDKVPSTFEFSLAGVTVREEIYERAEETSGRYRLRYKTLEPALGILEYDAVLDVQGIAEGQTTFSATREVRLTPGSTPDMLAGVVASETQCLKEHFAR